MTESELLQAIYASTQTIISLFSMFVTIVSGYIAGLYLFLKDAPLAMRLLALCRLHWRSWVVLSPFSKLPTTLCLLRG